MSAVRDAGNVLRDIKGISVRDAANVLRAAPSASIRDAGNVLRSFFSALSAVASPDFVSGLVSSSTSTSITTDATTASPTGGVSPFTYAWSAVNAAGWGINNPTSASTRFASPTVAPGNFAEGSIQSVITDAAGNKATTNTVLASANNIGSSGGGGTITP